MANYKDDKFEAVIDDIEKIQTAPSQYIGPIGSLGSLHVCKEIINNAIDECCNQESPGNHIKIYLDEAEDTIIVKDNGRGIPFDILKTVCTVLQSSTKFGRKNGGGSSAGQNGCGIKTGTALGELFRGTSEREGKKGVIEFSEGKLVQDTKVNKGKADVHGTTFQFKPSKIFMGRNSKIIPEDLMNWVEKIHYTVPPSTVMEMIVQPKKGGTKKKVLKNNKGGITEYIQILNEKQLGNPLKLGGSLVVAEEMTIKRDCEEGKVGDTYMLDRNIGLEFVMQLSTMEVPPVDSFCNFVNTTEGGVHIDAVKKALTDYFMKETTKLINNKDSKGLTIQGKDITQSLSIVINLQTEYDPEFVGQVKNTVGNGALHAPIRQIVKKALSDYFDRKPNELKLFCNLFKANARARVIGNAERKAELAAIGTRDGLSDFKNPNLIPLNAKSNPGYSEMYIVEGNSAGNSTARYDNNVQAIFKLRGFFYNSVDSLLSKMMDNKEVRNLIDALGCGVGKNFNIKKLKYDKIIIATDSDADGGGIANLLCAFFIYWMPQLVEEGRLYRVLSPLYKIKVNKEDVFTRSKEELNEEFVKNVIKSVSFIEPKTKKLLTKQDISEFMLTNKYYLEELNRIADQYSIHKDLVEFLVLNSGAKNISTLVRKEFPEIKVDNDVIIGVYANSYQRLIVDKIFMKNIKDLIDISKQNKLTKYDIIEKGKETKDLGLMTIGNILEYCNKFSPKILVRYKGLGELPAQQLKDTTFDPNNRELVQLKVTDLVEVLRIFRILQGGKPKDIVARKNLYQNMEVNRDLLDN